MTTLLLSYIHLDPTHIAKAAGYVGITLLVFAESGLLIGLLLPGDSLLFAAGLLSSTGLFHLVPLICLVAIAAILGDTVGYWFGNRVGIRLFARKESWLFKREYVTRTEAFYKKYGGRAVILARFVPIVRTLAPVLAGIGDMSYARFVSYNAIGGVLWGAGMLSLGFFLGEAVPQSEQYVLPLSLLIVVLSFSPIVIGALRKRTS